MRKSLIVIGAVAALSLSGSAVMAAGHARRLKEVGAPGEN